MKTGHKKIMIFGVFDRLHAGHLDFFRQARGYGEIIAVVARDAAVMRLKGRAPQQSEQERCAVVREIEGVGNAILGDTEQGTYHVLHQEKPSAICLGYDQEALDADLRFRMSTGHIAPLPIIRLEAHESGRLHTSLLTNMR